MIPTAQVQSADMGNNRNLLNEAQALARLGPHVNIVRFNEVVLTEQHVVLVMEWVGGGTLSSYCRKRPYLSEEEALYFFKQLVSAVEFCHKHHLAHRDIKLENVMVDTTTHPPRIKLADFGLSKHWEPVSNRLCRMQTIAGTPGYISPEIVSTLYGGPNSSYDGTKADVWALGVALVTLLLHHKPYAYSALQNLSVKALLKNMHHQQLHTRWVDTPPIRDNLPGISSAVRDLLSAIFVSDASERITLAGIKDHPWFQQRLSRRYQSQLDAMAAEQRQHTAAAASPAFSHELQERLRQMQQRLAQGGVGAGSLERVSFEPTASKRSSPKPATTDTAALADKGRAVGRKAAAPGVGALQLRRGIVT